MENPKLKTALTVLGVLILVVLMASVIYGLVRNLSNSSDDSSKNESDTEITQEKDITLEDDAKTGEVSFFARGPIVAREDHYEIKVTINRDRRSIEVYKGYQKEPIEQESFSNDLEAFTQFLYAAKRAGLFIEGETNANKDGYCYRGELRTYTTTGFNNNVDGWTNSCNDVGTLNDKFLLKLIKDQFPDYKKYVRNV